MNRIEGLLINRVRKSGDKGYKLGAGYNKSYHNAVEKFLASGKIVKKGAKLFATKQDRAGKSLEVKNDTPVATAAPAKKRAGRPRKVVAQTAETSDTAAPVPEPAPESTETNTPQ